jgi:hypothetical protein
MAAILALVGVPIAFSIAMLFLMMTSQHALSPVLGVGLIAALIVFFVGLLRFVDRLETSPGE